MIKSFLNEDLVADNRSLPITAGKAYQNLILILGIKKSAGNGKERYIMYIKGEGRYFQLLQITKYIRVSYSF